MQVRPLIGLFIAIFFLAPVNDMAVAVAAGSDTNWQGPYTKDQTLGNYLEQEYSAILKGCGINSLMHDKGFFSGGNVTLSAIPQVLQLSIGSNMGRKIWQQDQESIARIFAYVYDSQDPSFCNYSEKLLIYEKDFTADPALLIPEGSSSTIYTHNCSGILGAAANANITLPTASIESALKTEYSGDQLRMLALAHGRFSSPFAKQLHATTTKPEKLTALLSLWDWYGRNSDRVNVKNYIINAFNGAALMQLVDQKSNKAASHQLSGGLNFPFFSISGKNNIEIKTESKIIISKYSTAAFKTDDKIDVLMEEIPKPSDIKTQAALFSAKLTNQEETHLVKGMPALHKQRIEGVPERLCRDFWTVTSRDDGAELALLSTEVKRVENRNVPDCEFEVSFKPRESDFSSEIKNKLIDLKYDYEVISSIGNTALKIPATPVRYKIGRPVDVKKIDYDPRYTATQIGTSQELKWTIEVGINDQLREVVWGQPAVADIVLNCQGQPEIITVQQTALSENNRNANIVFTRKLHEPDNFDIAQSVLTAEKCNVIGNIQLQLKQHSKIISSDVAMPSNLTINFPKIKPSPTLADADYDKKFELKVLPAGDKEMRWNVKVLINDLGKIIDLNKAVQPEMMTVSCENKKVFKLDAINVSVNNSRNIAEIAFANADSMTDIDFSKNENVNCDLSGSLKFTTNKAGGTTLNLPLPKLTILYPKAKSQ